MTTGVMAFQTFAVNIFAALDNIYLVCDLRNDQK
jgi:hypothetical protein